MHLKLRFLLLIFLSASFGLCFGKSIHLKGRDSIKRVVATYNFESNATQPKTNYKPENKVLNKRLPNSPFGMQWVKVEELSDEFNAGFDTNKWHKSLWNYDEPVQMAAENSGVDNGYLWIKATKNRKNSKRWFKTSRVQSNTQIKYPMYTESRIKTAHISAYNTFWLNNGNISSRNEIDIIENNSKPSCNCQPDFPWQMNSQYFHVTNGEEYREHGNFDNRKLSANNPSKGVKWNEDFHIVGMWWINSRHIQFYINGEPAGKVVSAKRFTRDLNIIWDLWTKDADWLGGLALKKDLSDDSINTMKVDWIHTYKLVRR